MSADVIVRCRAVFDGEGLLDADAVALRDGAIAAIGTYSPAWSENLEPPRMLDLRDCTIVPGLLDGHDHLCFDLGDLSAQSAERTGALVSRAVRNAEAALRRGVTRLRDLGSIQGVGYTVRDAVERGEIRGPAVLAAGEWITPKGGHMWYAGREVENATEMDAAIRDQKAAGADIAKLVLSSGILTPSSTNGGQFGRETIAVAVETAHELGMLVAAHAHGGEGIRLAVDAGVDSIEHGTYATDDDLELMAARGTTLVSTIGVLDRGRDSDSLPDEVRRAMGTAGAAAREMLARARERGVSVTVGTDLCHGSVSEELEILVEVGYSTMEVLRAGTSEGASHVGFAGRRLEQGQAGDLVAVGGDPLRSTAALRNVVWVYKEGREVWPQETRDCETTELEESP